MNVSLLKIASKISLVCFFVVFVPISCEKKTPKPPVDFIEKEKFTNLVIEFQLVQSMLNTYNDTLLAIQLRDSILANYQIKLQQFYDSEKWYHHNIEEYQKILNKAMDILSEEQTRLLDNKSAIPKDSLILKESDSFKNLRR
ncbi:MAG: DUF4296 domain-containing protein [Bacteroidetes bacterium]|nr:DUF4296 domain-containing protein [Bacteroidota bacterium]NCQ10569.1 DUF4296 domain-containing protein [Bacteroidota bacterium]